MTDKTITALTAAGAITGAELLAIVQGGNSRKLTVLALSTAILGATVLPGTTVTTSKPLIDHTQIWNGAGVTFTGWKLNATATAFAAASMLLDLQKDGSTRFNIRQDGRVTCQVDAYFNYSGGSPQVSIGGLGAGIVSVRNTGAFSFTNDGSATGAVDLSLKRSAAGIGTVQDASAAPGGWLYGATVLAVTATPKTVVAADSGRTFTNEGATAKIVFNLPTAVAGYQYSFSVQDADGVQVVAAAGDTIRIAANPTAAAGNIESTTIGSTVLLVSINATEWISFSVNGTWVVT